MDLRPTLQPSKIDEELAARLAELAAKIDGARPGEWEEWLAEFNNLASTSIPFGHFQGIYGGEDHIDWVRRILHEEQTTPAEDVTREELIEIVCRAMPENGYADHQAYMEILDKNVPRPDASNLIFYPPDYDAATNTWADGRMMGEYDPTPEQIVDWALQPDPRNAEQ
ncbi:hypothetical protein [Rubripirellula reticaptiva]|uniref:Uncharacterized protein n=1 Tax=Rubripirellula reticaptiva TaxID=2528013 RepID=A0A5C6EQU5_9BACT|nr:hypothetical protein [Rubripirellula reticaptiva]TWU51422.1 hypothetical protein Poly59_30140 [Rubripirellula reticaptiva]